jgi:hypothetical protein
MLGVVVHTFTYTSYITFSTRQNVSDGRKHMFDWLRVFFGQDTRYFFHCYYDSRVAIGQFSVYRGHYKSIIRLYNACRDRITVITPWLSLIFDLRYDSFSRQIKPSCELFQYTGHLENKRITNEPVSDRTRSK